MTGILGLVISLAPTPGPSGAPPAGGDGGYTALPHAMTPTGVAVTILLAILIDAMSVGPDSIRDRIAWLFSVTAIRDGFAGSQVEAWTTGQVAAWIHTGLQKTGDAYIAAADANKIVGALIGCIAIFTAFALVPSRWSTRLGPAARIRFGRHHGTVTTINAAGGGGYRLNPWLWTSAILIGVSGHLAQGAIGAAIDTSLNILVWPVVGIVTLIFGA